MIFDCMYWFSLHIDLISLIGAELDGLRKKFFKLFNPQTLSFLVKICQNEVLFAVNVMIGAI